MNLDFEKSNGLIPAIIQDANTNVVLMLGFMNEEAYNKTIENNIVTFFSRTKNRLWTKGETSNNFLTVVKIIPDCDNDTILIKAIPQGNTCHTGQYSCFNEQPDFLYQLQNIIAERHQSTDNKSYVKSLFNKGINKISQKVGEEAVETIIEALNNDDDKFVNESADLLFHYLILLKAKGVCLNDIIQILKERHKK